LKRILILMMTAILICASVFALASCDKDKGDDTTHTHTMGEWKITVEADCVNDGKETRKCTSEGCDYAETKAIPALGHDLKDVEGMEPDCVEIGFKPYKVCTRCVYNTYVEIPATGHDYTIDAEKNPIGDTCVNCGQVHICVDHEDWYTVEEADCTGTGIDEHKCKVCNRVEEKITPKVDHNYGEDGKCTECGATESNVPELPDQEF